MSRSRPWLVAVGAALSLVYVLPLFVPPPAVWPGGAAPGAGRLGRLFPDVPEAWVSVRLLALFAGALLLGLSARHHVARPERCDDGQGRRDAGDANARPAWRWVALGVAAAHAVSGIYAEYFTRAMEVTYLLVLPVPAVLFVATASRSYASGLPRTALRVLALVPVPLLWVVSNVWSTWRSPLAASSVDMWLMVERLGNVASGRDGLLAGGAAPGLSNAYMILEGVSLLDPRNPEPSFALLQVMHVGWACLLALVTGAMTWKLLGAGAGLVAQGVLLWSPYVLSSLVSPAPLVLFSACPMLLVYSCWRVHERRSDAALVGFGALAGFSATNPTLVPVVIALAGVMAFTVIRVRSIPWLAVITSACSFLAARLPGLPDVATLRAMASEYTGSRGNIHAVVRILLGQDSPHLIREALGGGQAQPFDVPVGALLSPFAIARSPIRLWGDVLFDPFGTVLLASGLVLAVFVVRRDRRWWPPLAAVTMSILAGATSSGDFVSYTRIAPGIGPLTLVAALGFATLRRAVCGGLPALGVAGGCVVVVAVSGASIFYVVNPRILPASWLTIGLEALEPRPAVEVTLLEDGGPPYVPWLHVRRIASLLPAVPVSVRTAGAVFDANGSLPDSASRIYLWSPAVEQDVGVAAAVCRRWPAATLYELWDRAGLFRARGATLPGAAWVPALPERRWRAFPCAARGPAGTWSGPSVERWIRG